MRALVWEAPRTLNLREQNRPDLQPGEVLVKVAYGGICGSELGGYLGHNALRVPPLIMGHEFSGTIIQKGQALPANAAQLEVDQPVTVNPLNYDDDCEYVARNLHHLSPTRTLIGAHRPGAFAEYVAVPAKLVTPLPEGLSLRTGALTEPVACGVRIAELAGDVSGKDCLVIGAGPIGLLALQNLLLNGAKRVFIADLDADRLAMGESLGGVPIHPEQRDVVEAVRKATDGWGVPLSVDAVGTGGTRTQCISATRPKGTMILSGLHEEVSEMPAADIIRREIDVRGSFAYSPANFAQAIGLLKEQKIRLDPWIVEAPLEEGGMWFERLIEEPGNVSKVLLVP